MWLYDDDAEFFDRATGFRLALNAYLKHEKRSTMSTRALNDLIANDFQGILDWAWKDERRPLNRQNLGVASYFLRRWNDSIRYWTDETKPGSFKFWEYLGEAYRCAGDFRGASKAFERLIHNDSTNATIWIAFGRVLEASGELEKARHAFETAISLESTPAAWTALGDVFKAEGNRPKAIHAFHKAIDENPATSVAWRRLGELYETSGDITGAIKIFEIAAERYPSYLGSWDCLVSMYEAAGDTEGAVEALRRACKQNPSNIQLWTRLGNLYGKIKNDGIGKVFEETLKNNENSAWLYLALSDVHLEDGKFAEAVATLEKGVEFMRKAKATYLLARFVATYGRAGEYNRAIMLFDGHNHGNPTMRGVVLGEMLMEKQDYMAAIEMFGNITVRDPRQSWAWEGLGKSYRGSGDFCKAKEIFKKGIECDPGDSRPWFQLAEIYELHGDFIAAANIYRAAIQQIPADYLLNTRLGDTLQRSGAYHDAINAYNESVRKAPKGFISAYLHIPKSRHYNWPYNISIDQNSVKDFLWYRLGKAHESNHSREMAIQVFDRAISEYEAVIEGRSSRELMWHYTSFPGEPDVCGIKKQVSRSVIWVALGDAYTAKGSLGRARAAFQAACDLNQGVDFRSRVEERIKSLQLVGT
jgi:tetratricopeptide (TPR) repeat protein